MERIRSLTGHLGVDDSSSPLSTNDTASLVQPLKTSTPLEWRIPVLDDFKVEKLKSTILGHPDEENIENRRLLLEAMRDPLFRPQLYATVPEQRELTLKRLRKVSELRILKMGEIAQKFKRFVSFQESLVLCDMSLSVKSSVHWGLFAGSVVFLGTEKHRQYFDDIDICNILGCFALTEMGHGSNVKGIETLAEYDNRTREFVIHTPNDTAQKMWIGNAGVHGTMATVFANLVVNGENHGLHPFLVQIRDPKTNATMPGVTAADNGPKMGLNGVDNGRLWFNKVRIPYDNLLDRFGGVNEKGEYTTPIKNPNVRQNSMLEALIGGRVTVGAMALQAAKLGLTIAVQYALQRRQFGNPEELLIDYLTHQRRLFPLIAATYAYQITSHYIIDKFSTRSEKDARDVFLMACGLKATVTWHRSETLQICRESCGGFGFAASSRIGLYKNDADVDLTYEGDNTVLMQAVAKALLMEFKSYFTGAKAITGMLSYTYSKGHIGIFLRNKNFFVKRLHTEAHLLDPEMLLDAFIYREFKVLRQLVKSLRTKVKSEKMTGAKAWNASLDLVMKLATCYVERLTIERFLQEIQKSSDDVKPILNLLCVLFCLTKIERDMGWFLSNKYFAPVKAQAIENAINKVCVSMRDHALPLVKAFDIPDYLISAPIAGDYVAHFSDPKNY
ncbi:hypothetical protein SAMD00019534_017420 [Acytostelium subglobosum LB1]|uniref:hypothetical protein n=1 Tax=Acytostelium subglobosum LB1 TaxID=1410327 RepID=UPI0006449CCF|nr:hypothetical protein SAMD00019534_017420 [Acytostelium subglobosum LB1]GAM18567.1 hypothetical protein SAMD00019534_017420 [Acytostelium subglobosum LB1]|eukprot:XP_012757787.1 hypothetical protein SAMD00019534_017420 [Acytostelium subglobosum LB1]